MKKFILAGIVSLVLIVLSHDVTSAQTPFLTFPLPNRSLNTVVINSVFDHSMTQQYCPDDIVITYTGEEAKREFGVDPTFSTNPTGCGLLQGFKNSSGNPFVLKHNNYSGGEFLFYDGHPGYDYKTTDQDPTYGKIDVLAAAPGTVVCVALRVQDGANIDRLENEAACTEGRNPSTGRTAGEIKIDHGNGYFTIYIHLSSAYVHAGETVLAGKEIGVSGETGAPGAPHLHFEVRKDIGGTLVPVDPYGWQGTGNDPYTRATNINLWSTETSQPHFSGQGFDTCEIPSLNAMQTWINASPYRAVNLYIGGSARSCPNSNLSSSFVSQLDAQGWKFIPTWVGPQASCSGYVSRMSQDPSRAYVQGIWQANAAIITASALGFSSGTIIYYDLEGYDTTNVPCRDAAKSFINGWSSRLQETFFLSGVYGSSCASAMSDFVTISNVPDAVWLANPTAGSYDPNAIVWGASCVSDSLWSNHQRIKQYTSGHDETWGGVELNIDSNVIDGIVAEWAGSNTSTLRFGDLNQDIRVDIYDVSIMLSCWGKTEAVCLQKADINGPQRVPDGKIDIYDANRMMVYWTG